MNNGEDDVCVCPSFNSYSSDRLAEVAVTVAGNTSSAASIQDSGGDDFEFAFIRQEKEVSAAEFLYSGPVFPVFNRDLIGNLGESTAASGGGNRPEETSFVTLSQLFADEDDERYSPPSCSSSEVDELENIPAGTYCVWRPRIAKPPLPSQCKKSKSTGSASKRWKVRDLLRRSKSDGKESFVFLTPKLHREEKSEKLMIGAPRSGYGKGSPSAAAASAHEAFYVRNRALKEGDKKKSYLPYRRDIVGFFANVDGVRRTY